MPEFFKHVTLRDGTSIGLKYLTSEDFDLSLDFFRRQPEQDRAYLRNDVTRRAVIEGRIREIEEGLSTVIIAFDEDRIIADALLYTPKRGWYRKTGELRLIIDVAYRGRGLGTLLAREIFMIAIKKGIRKLEADCMETQAGMIQVLQSLGFEKEGALKNFVVDMRGREHDLILLGMQLS
jgi:RimJ/RimL family protein N-acetyltransferase